MDDLRSPRVRRACLDALLQLHLCGWCHGDARVANVVEVERSYKWVDFMLGHSFAGRDGSSVVAHDVNMLVASVCARALGVSSADVKLLPRVVQLTHEYSDCFGARIDQGKAASLMDSIFQACEAELLKV